MFFIKKQRVYLKTYLYSAHEIKFIKLNICESFPYIDKVIICEFNRTHLGTEKKFIFNEHIDTFTKEEQNKIIYLQCDVSDQITQGENSDLVHKNENLMRGYFSSQIDLNKHDIIVSVDADEIIFGRYYDRLINQIEYFNQAIQLKLHQFIYRINYLWANEIFIAPTIARVSFYQNKYPGQWRYDGDVFPEVVGCHFSWCMTVDEMIKKLGVYSHHYDYRHLAKKEILEKAIQEKTYPFEPDRSFYIEVLDMTSDRNYYPSSIYTMLDEFTGLIA